MWWIFATFALGGVVAVQWVWIACLRSEVGRLRAKELSAWQARLAEQQQAKPAEAKRQPIPRGLPDEGEQKPEKDWRDEDNILPFPETRKGNEGNGTGGA